MKLNITEDEWQAAIQALDERRGDEGKTAREVAGERGASIRHTQEMLNRGVAAGAWIRGVGYRRDNRGRWYSAQVYRPAPKGKARG